MSYDDAYEAAPDLFGAGPEALLVDHWEALPPGRPVLDLGAGQGRHALWLARRGITVEALDPSTVAVDTVRAAAEAEGLPVDPVRGGFESHPGAAAPYGGVLIFGLIQILRWDGIRELQRRVERWTAPGSLLFITAFSTRDEAFARLSRTLSPIGPRSFVTADGEPRTFLEPNEILTLFPGCAPLHHWEGLGPEHRHGDGPPERHHRIEAVLRRGLLG
jgi:SAM-dependent methyltransferase